MKKASEAVLAKLALAFQTETAALSYFSGGHEWSDGVLYEYLHNGKARILKIMDMPMDQAEDKVAAIRARLQFVRFLGDRGVDIVSPEHTVDGSLYKEVTDSDRLYIAYSYHKRDGGHIFHAPKEEHEALFVQWGKAMGRMHAAAKEYPVWHLLPEDPEGRLLGWEQEWHGFHTWCKDEEVKEAWRKLKTRLDALPIERSGFGFTHNDLHIENMLAHNGSVTVLDFDVSNPHWFVCDLAVAIHSIFTYSAHGKLEHPPVDPARLKVMVQAFMRGYKSENQLDIAWFDHVELFLQYRRILLFIVFAEGLAQHDPAHYQAWRSRILENAPFPEYR